MTTASDHLRTALDELDSEYSELQHEGERIRNRMAEISALRTPLAALIGRMADEGAAALPAAKVAAAKAALAPERAKERAPKAATKPARKAEPRSHAEVARIAREAHAAGRSMTDAVKDHFGISGAAAATAISTARKEHDIPRNGSGGRPPKNPKPAPKTPSPAAWAPKPGEMVVRCEEPGCTHAEPITGVSALNRHCIAEHKRAATPSERAPVAWEAAA